MFDITIPGPESDLPARVYSQIEPKTIAPALVFLHGSGFVIGDSKVTTTSVREFAAPGKIVVVSITGSRPSTSSLQRLRMRMRPCRGWLVTAKAWTSTEVAWRWAATALGAIFRRRHTHGP